MLQTAFNGVVTGVIMALPALAVTLLFGVLKFPNFAVGAMMTVAAYLAFALNAQLGWPLAAATVAAAVAMGALCIGIDQVTFRPLRERGAITLMVASLGLGFILENVARFAYGNTARSFAIELARPFRFADVRMNHEQMITIAVSSAAMIAMWVLLTRLPMGRAMRAVADNPSLALVRGIESPRVIRWTWFLAGVLLALGGVLIGMARPGWRRIRTRLNGSRVSDRAPARGAVLFDTARNLLVDRVDLVLAGDPFGKPLFIGLPGDAMCLPASSAASPSTP